MWGLLGQFAIATLLAGALFALPDARDFSPQVLNFIEDSAGWIGNVSATFPFIEVLFASIVYIIWFETLFMFVEFVIWIWSAIKP